MVRPEFLRRLGTIVALLGIGCLLVALVLPWVRFEDLPYMAGDSPDDYSLLRLLVTPGRLGFHPEVAILLFHLLPFLGTCLVAVAGLRAWRGSAATRTGSARLLLGMSCALLGLTAIPGIVHMQVGWVGEAGPPLLRSAGPGASLASLGFVVVVAGGVLLAVSSGWQSRLLLAVALRHVGAVVALLGIACLLMVPVLPWVSIIQFYSPPSVFVDDLKGILPGDYSLSRLLVIPAGVEARFAESVLTLYLLPFLGSCCVIVDALRAWRGSAAQRAAIALPLSLLGMSCALFGLGATPALVQVAFGIFKSRPPLMHLAGAGAGFASLGFGAVVAGGVLLASGALLHQWTQRRTDSRASATTTG